MRRRAASPGTFTKEQQTALELRQLDPVRRGARGSHRLLDEQHAVSGFYYVSDHGENDGNAAYLPFGHGTLSRQVLHVPLLIWLSPEYRRVRTRQTTALEDHLAAPVSSTTTFHTLLDLAGVGTDGAQSIASPEYRPAARLVTNLHGDLKDYDRDIEARTDGTP